ncbi:MAG TPA: tetratricopeptide repeat protein [Kofleriaceae bacterium]
MFFELDARVRHPFGTEYLPVRDVLVALDMALWGPIDQGPHVTQLVLYGLSVYGLGTLLVRFGMRRDIAWMATLLWAVHPLHVEAVAWLSERKGILAGLFVIASGHAWVRFRDGRSRWWLVLGAIAAVAAVWSKAFAMFAPMVFALWDLLLLQAGRRRWTTIGVIGGAVFVAAIPVIVVARDAGVVDGSFEVQPDDRWTAAIGALGHYVQTMVLSRAPSLSYPIQTAGASVVDLVVGVAAVLASFAVVLVRGEGRRWRIAIVGWAWILYLPISHLVTRVHIPVADRFVYLWTLAGCIAAAWLISLVRSSLRAVLLGALVALLAIKSVRAERAWTNSYELFANASATNPGDPRAAQNLADTLVAMRRTDEAMGVIDRGLAHNMFDPYLLSTKAAMLRSLQDPRALGIAALAAATGHASTMWLYAAILLDHGRPAEALTFAEAAARRRPETAEYASGQVELLVVLGRLHEAETVARTLLARHPSGASHMTLAKVLAKAGRQREAALHHAIARQLGARE